VFEEPEEFGYIEGIPPKRKDIPEWPGSTLFKQFLSMLRPRDIVIFPLSGKPIVFKLVKKDERTKIKD